MLPEMLLSRSDLRAMIRVMRTLYRLQQRPAYRLQLAAELPEVARFDPGHASVMMGYDFHLTPEGPRLIEVNTNAGGALLACRAYHPTFPATSTERINRYQTRLLETFAREMHLFSGGRTTRPNQVIILDEEPEKQYLAEEMHVMRGLFNRWGVEAALADPSALDMGEEGVFFQGKTVDMIYNRHCDFYLDSPELAGLRAAYLAGRLCLTPNPRTYALLADKRRMTLWSDPARLADLGLTESERSTLQTAVPVSRLLAQMEPDSLWKERKRWVFKPVTAFGSRGVLLGDSISRQRFQGLNPDTTLVQQFIPPTAAANGRMKVDWRLFAYQEQLLGVAPRLYQGQVTNFRESGSGYAPVRLTQ
ncbi:MAG: hypothetical protein HQL90_15030 [Magnetococcales bacterium]|nr:hypothetical protein [Magnetococcales bacterium]